MIQIFIFFKGRKTDFSRNDIDCAHIFRLPRCDDKSSKWQRKRPKKILKAIQQTKPGDLQVGWSDAAQEKE